MEENISKILDLALLFREFFFCHWFVLFAVLFWLLLDGPKQRRPKMGEAKETKRGKKEKEEKNQALEAKRNHALLIRVIYVSEPLSQTQRRGESPDGRDRAMHLQVLSTHTYLQQRRA